MKISEVKREFQLQQLVHTLTEKIALMNTRHFGRSTEKLEALPGQLNIFNEAEVAAEEAIAEPAIEQQVVVRRKQKGKRKEDLSHLPKRIQKHERPFTPQRRPMWTPSSGLTVPWICYATALPHPLWWPPS